MRELPEYWECYGCHKICEVTNWHESLDNYWDWEGEVSSCLCGSQMKVTIAGQGFTLPEDKPLEVDLVR